MVLVLSAIMGGNVTKNIGKCLDNFIMMGKSSMTKITLDVDEECLDKVIVKELKCALDYAQGWKELSLIEDRKYYKKLAKHLKTVIDHFNVDYKK
jgi:hypothetical protein